MKMYTNGLMETYLLYSSGQIYMSGELAEWCYFEGIKQLQKVQIPADHQCTEALQEATP